MRLPVFIFFFIIIPLFGCASAPAPRQAVEQDIQSTVQQFAKAVQAHDANEVYALMSSAFRIQFTEEAFREYFKSNYDAFAEYSEMLSEDPATLQIEAVYDHDPCKNAALQLSGMDDWKLEAVPWPPRSIEDVKQDLLDTVHSGRFMEWLDRYALIHPEWSGVRLRHLKRILAFTDIGVDQVSFLANEAILFIPDTAVIRLACNRDGWSIVQCYSAH